MIRKTLFTAVALLLLSVPCWGVTVNVGTPDGNAVSTTYYMQPGDSASGSVTGFGGSVSVTTSGNVHKGVIRAENGAGDYQFSPFTGSGFTASGMASSQGVGAAAESPNPRVDVFVVTQSGGLGASTVGGTPMPSYGTINAGVTAAGGDASTRPDWVLVDRGIYKESTAINGFEEDSQLTSVWGAGKTVVGYSAGVGTVINVNNSPGFVIDGFTIKANPNQAGITANSSPGLQIANNRIEGSGSAGGIDSSISASDSEGAQFYRNEVSGFSIGIVLDLSPKSVVKTNTVQDSRGLGILVRDSGDCKVEGNTVQGSGFDLVTGMYLSNSPTTMVKGNTITANVWGIQLGGSTTNSRVEENNIYGNQVVGLWNNVETTTNAVNNNWWGKPAPTYQGGLGLWTWGSLGTDIWDAGTGANDLNPARAPFAY